ncbi:FAD-dependent oxidoreductase [Haladaptatus halobius]|uniref:FAD-dependent oxidoreductase n=1 Tax=Haladaptatus halobius TaxID=2884875 RepID=UPI001D0A9D8B|nr:FAD-dependent oxidoreductase [Haladaptatus halobius]
MVSYDVTVIGATPGGVMAAVHAARAGRETCLVALNDHLGGMMASGLGVTDTLLSPRKARAPLLDEFFERVRIHYRETYGDASEQYRNCNAGLFFEPHVAEGVFEEMVDVPELTVRRQRYPASAEREGSRVRCVTLESFADEPSVRVDASVFIDATYEGDLAAIAGVPYRVGRESREEYGERFAGRVFVDAENDASLRPGTTGEGDDAVQSYNYRLCLCSDPDNRRYPEKPDGYDRREYLWIVKSWDEMAAYLDEQGIEDGMAAGLRSRTSDALADAMTQWMEDDGPPDVGDENRWTRLEDDPYRPVDPIETEPLPCPAQTSLLERSGMELLGLFQGGDFEWGKLPNDKHDLNTCDLVGESDAYPEADWDGREEIEKRHRDYVLGFLYFLQNDDAVPPRLQERVRKWGLAADEFEDNDNVPFQLYVREARRIEGRKTFTERDALLAEGLDRAPINETAVAIAEYPLDAHDVRPMRRTGTTADGRFFLTELTVPSQIPYECIVPEDADNLLVPMAMSASHVGFQTIRLEPTWIQLGEAAGIAAAESLERGTVPGTLDPTDLQRRLAEVGNTLAFFTDFDAKTDEPWVPAVQFLATKGFFRGYEARPEAPLDENTAEVWARSTATLLANAPDDSARDATERARVLPLTPSNNVVSAREFIDDVRQACKGRGMRIVSEDCSPRAAADDCGLTGADELSRGDACRIVYRLLAGLDTA